MANRVWIELTGDRNVRLSLSCDHISSVERKGAGSVIVCDGVRYELVSIPYENALKMARFVRDGDEVLGVPN